MTRLSRRLICSAAFYLLACRGRPAAPSQAIPGITVDAPCVDDACAEGLVCRVAPPGSDTGRRCALDVGRCRDDWDCGRSVQRCMRLGTRLGVCQDSGL